PWHAWQICNGVNILKPASGECRLNRRVKHVCPRGRRKPPDNTTGEKGKRQDFAADGTTHGGCGASTAQS
ncbi:hypothetical protein, partial [Klebsiella pneumoniae]|uniref:hypothetical protein n=1 Tax=Klebsiella pneumoniae TaxID=573 RepID=UPI001952A10B